MAFRQWIPRVITVAALVAVSISLQLTVLSWFMDKLDRWLNSFGLLGLVLLTSIIIAQALVAPWTGAWLLVAGSNFFDPTVGWLAVWVGAVLGNILAYEVSTFLFKPLHAKFATFEHKLHALLPTILLLFTLPLFPVAVLSWLLGLVHYKRKLAYLSIGAGLTLHTLVTSFAEEHVYTDSYQSIQIAVMGVVLIWLIVIVVYQSRSANL